MGYWRQDNNNLDETKSNLNEKIFDLFDVIDAWTYSAGTIETYLF